MNVLIHAPWQVNEWFENLAKESIEKLETYYDRIERADIYLKNDESDPERGKTVEIRLAIPQNDLFAAAHSDEIEKALNEATHKIRRQLIKRKELLNKH
ncbi:ribosome hibernation-promoting factor, HPF/YfiA family [Flavilitoribacter nigricans]|uniref:Ribosomal subunit interface protein n=1 Tax=Flavilitoribacter nigricans (strain ATCC 23147 / DSM 23189 / NBRC 102662 / NCIMB 1420 / SS-2) TaxID=1122177 RepID=A0A2D0NB17_FLAN2|nr:ribosome-associated translation inhibitor RaiA [Flavilitoribacter nigricans]PHN05704.1 ribosomal subunit interface protein [Flavilitoribacter nigricans DSM 23189 = NBRC 102662]